MLAETIQRLETKIATLLKDSDEMRDENRRLHAECEQLLRERDQLREGLDRILARLDAFSEAS